MKSLDLLDGWSHRGDATVADRVAIATRSDGSNWSEKTYAGLDRQSTGVVRGLAAAGVGPGDRVALLAESGGDWAAAFLGILRRGAIAVPLDPKLTTDELAPLCRRSRLAAAIVSPAYAARWPDPAPVLDPSAPTSGAPISPGSGGETSRALSDPAVLVWTSGSTGEPKGVALSFANLAYVVARASAVQGTGPEARWLSVLPPNHLLELCCGLLPALAAGSTTFVARSIVPHELGSMMAESRVDRMVVVPIVLRMLKRHIESAISQKIGRRGGFAGAYLRAAGRVAAVTPSRSLRRALHAPLHRRLGGHLRAFYCGGAPLDPTVATFFDRIGIGVYPGYGLTEASPTVSMNSPGHNRAGSVGLPLPGTDVRIAADGEILVHGPGVMLGYWDDDAATREAVDPDGWLRTGDLGHLDDDGYLFVTGRSKSMIVLDSGKKVQPEEVEAALERSELFAEVCVLGWRDGRIDGRAGEQVCAVVVPAPGLPMTEEDAVAEVRRLTAGLSGFKRPTVVRVYEGELPKTAKRSLRRAEVAKFLQTGLLQTGLLQSGPIESGLLQSGLLQSGRVESGPGSGHLVTIAGVPAPPAVTSSPVTSSDEAGTLPS